MVQPANRRFVMESDLDSFRDEAYRYVDTLYFTTSGNFFKFLYPWLRGVRVTCLGGGGGGAGAAITAATTTSIGTGGNGGHYAQSFISNIPALPDPIAVTVGLGGQGATGAVDGAVGGTSSFGSLVSANGGAGGNARGATAPPYITDPNVNDLTATGDITMRGGAANVSFATSTGFGMASGGGSSVLGFSSNDRVFTTSGIDGFDELQYGCGGNGGGNGINQVITRFGGNGGRGIVVVDLYA